MNSTPRLRDRQEHIPVLRQPPRSRHVSSVETWELYREEIYRIYVEQNNTLTQTMRIMEITHQFQASKRKYKAKLKEWNIDKNLPAADMRILVAKADNRKTQEGKETVFYNGGHEINAEKFENFKKRASSNAAEMASPSAATPANITYHTPYAESDVGVIVNEIENDDIDSDEYIDLSQAIDATATENWLRTEDVADIVLRYSAPAKDTSLNSSSELGSEVATQEISVLDCGHRKEGTIAKAFEESLSAPNLDEYLSALKIIYGLPESPNHRNYYHGDQMDHSCIEGGDMSRYGISFSTRICAIFDLTSILERQKDSDPALPNRPLGHEETRSIEDRLSCHWCSDDYVSSFRQVIDKYIALSEWQHVFLAMAVLRAVYFELKCWNELMSVISTMRKILDNSIEMNRYLTPDELVEGIALAGTYSVWRHFALAHSVFSSVLPELLLLSDVRYESDIIYGYIEFGFHYERQELWLEAHKYLSLAHKRLEMLNRYREATRLEARLDMALRSINDNKCTVKEKARRDELESIEMSRARVLLRTISPVRNWKTTANGCKDEGDLETDTTSCKYGQTYSVSEITGISDSRFMVP